MPESQIKVGVTALVIQDKKILLGRRINVTGDGTWGVPGGHLEFGESMVSAVKRELEEETSLIADELEFVHVVNDPRKDTHYIHVTFLIKRWHGTLENKEPHKCGELKWFSLDELPNDEVFFGGHATFIPSFLKKQPFVDLKRKTFNL